MSEWLTADHLARPAESEASGTLIVAGIGPGSPDHLTAAARKAIRTADAVYAAPTYQAFLARDGLVPEDGPELIDSSRDDLVAQARETFDRVRNGERVVHVSGGDPTVYGKSDLLVGLAETEADGRVPIEILPGVTAALGGAAALGAPLSNDFCSISCSTARRDRAEIEGKLGAAAEAGFVIALYNAWRSLPWALEVIGGRRSESVPVAVLEGVARGDNGATEAVSIARLGDAVTEIEPETPGTVVIVGTEDSRVLEPAGGGRPFLVTPRGDEPPLDTNS